MADNIQTTFGLNDQMSGNLNNIIKALRDIDSRSEDLKKSLDAVDRENFKNLRQSFDKLLYDAKDMTQETSRAEASIDSLNLSNTSNLQGALNNTSSAIDNISDLSRKAEQSLNALNSSSFNGLDSSVDEVNESIKAIGREASKANNSLKQFSSKSSFSDISSSANQAKHSINELGNESEEASSKHKKHNQSLSESSNVVSGLNDKFDKLVGTIKTVVGTYASLQSLKAAIDWSDEISQTTSRLNLVNESYNKINGTAQTTREVQDKIFRAAQSSRGSYADLQGMVAKLGASAQSSFKDTDAIIDFGSTMNKIFALSGASAEEMNSSILQLSQALASGVLQGDEFKSLSETNPVFLDYLAKGMGVAKEDLKQMGSEGHLTSETIVTAMTNMSGEISSQFEQLQPTFGNVWTNFTNTARHAFEPVAQELGKLAGNADFQSALDQLASSIADLAPKIAELVSGIVEKLPAIAGGIANAFDWLVNNGDSIIGILAGVAAGFTAIQAASKIQGIAKSIQEVGSIGQYLSSLSGNAGAIIALLNPMNLLIGAIVGVAAAAAYLVSTGKTITDVIQGFASFNESVRNFASSITDGIMSMFEDVKNNFPRIAAEFGAMIPTIVEGLLSSIMTFAEVGAQIVGTLITGFVSALPSIIEGGMKFIANLIMGIYSAMPRLVDQGLTMVENLVTGFVNNFPLIMQKAGEAIGTFVRGIGDNLPSIVAAGVSMIIGLVQTIGAHLPTLLQKGTELLATLTTGFINAIPGFLQGLGGFIGSMATTIWDNREQIATAGKDLLAALGEGLMQIGGYLWNTLLSVGSSIVEGIKQGAMNVWSSITGWFSDRWNELISNVMGIFGIASPSKVMGDVGTNLMQGLWNGLQGMWDGLLGFAGTIWDSIKNVFTGGGQDQEQGQVIDYTAQIEQTRAQLAQLQSEVANGYNQILSTVQVINAQIVNQGIGMFGAMAGAVVNSAANMVAGVNAQLYLIPQSLALALTGAIPVAQGYFATLSEIAKAQVTDLVATAQNALLALIPAFASILGDLRNRSIILLKELQNQAIGVVNFMANTVVTTVSIMNDNMLDLISALSINFIFMLQTMITSVITLMTTLCEQMVALIQRLVKDITNTINTLPPTFKKVGTDMMNSLKAGIEASRQGVLDVTSSLVQQLKATFETGLGIHSPSDYMIWVGQMLLKGLIEGLSSSQIQSFIESVIQDMQSSFEAGKFNANELVNFLSDDATLNLIGKITGMDLGKGDPQQIAYPLIGTLGTQTSWFGHRESPGGIGSTNHQGADLAAPTGTPIAAALGGTVTTANWYGGYGQAVVVDSGNGLSIVYGHMSEILATQGQQVGKGAQIGLVGSTGNSTGPHLHFEMRQDGEAFDPQPYLEGASISAGNTLANAIQMAYNAKHGIVAGNGNIPYDISAGAAQWTPQVLQALAMLGQPASLLNGVLYAIECESGGNPNAINDWDSNAEMGDPSRGLLQTIGSTFNAYRNPTLSANIYDPLSNIYAGLNYMIQRYGSVDAVVTPRLGHWYGYAVGTRNVPEDMLAMIHKGEAILPANQNPYKDSGGNYLNDIVTQIIPEGLNPTNEVSQQTNANNLSSLETNVVESNQNEASDYISTISTTSVPASNSNVINNFHLTVGNIYNHGDLDNAKEEILTFVENNLIDSISSGGYVVHGY